MQFEDALVKLKHGSRVARKGWNGKGMWLTLMSAQWSAGEKHPKDMPEDWEGYLPFIAMYTANKRLVPWLASQTDILADDWIVVLA